MLETAKKFILMKANKRYSSPMDPLANISSAVYDTEISTITTALEKRLRLSK